MKSDIFRVFYISISKPLIDPPVQERTQCPLMGVVWLVTPKKKVMRGRGCENLVMVRYTQYGLI